MLKHLTKRYCFENRRFVVSVERCISSNKDHTVDATVSSEEMHQFRQLSSEWWRPGGEFEVLRTMNKLRLPLIKELLNCKDKVNPLKGYSILDVGCGGGILAEPIARLGGKVFAIDPLKENIEFTQSRQLNNPELSQLTYKCTTVDDLALTDNGLEFDLVIASEVLEHVYQPDVFVRSCCHFVKPGGHILFTTINRTLLSTLFVKYAAEYLLRFVPPNTHDKNKFVTTDEITDYLRGGDMFRIQFRGLIVNPITLKWSWIPSTLMNYACYAQKPL